MTDEHKPALTKESMDKVIKLLDKYMPDDLRFSMDSKGFKIFIQNMPASEYEDTHVGLKVRAGSVAEVKDNNVELTIASIMSKEIKKLLSHSAFDAITVYSFSVWQIRDGKVFFAQAVATK